MYCSIAATRCSGTGKMRPPMSRAPKRESVGGCTGTPTYGIDGTGTFNNTGTFQAGGGSGTFTFASGIAFNNTNPGQVTAATGVLAGVGLLNEMSALQRRPATRVAPVVFVVQITVPVTLAPLITGESWTSTPLGGVALVGFLALVAAGAAALGRTAAVSGLVASGVDELGDGYPGEASAGEPAAQ